MQECCFSGFIYATFAWNKNGIHTLPTCVVTRLWGYVHHLSGAHYSWHFFLWPRNDWLHYSRGRRLTNHFESWCGHHYAFNCFIFDLGMIKKPVMKIRKTQRRQMKMRKSKYKNICLMFYAETMLKAKCKTIIN